MSFTPRELRVRWCESRDDYRAQNPSSSASGAWQFVNGTWNGFMGYRHAAAAPRWVQDLKARRYINAHGLAAWSASRPCWDG